MTARSHPRGVVFFDTSSNFHPYECNGQGKCIHCDRAVTDNHDPKKCALCDDGAGRMNAPSLLDGLYRKAERHLVYPLNRDECIGLVKAAQAVEEFADDGLIDRDIADAVLFHVKEIL